MSTEDIHALMESWMETTGPKVEAVDWENAAHVLFWEKGDTATFEKLAAMARDNATLRSKDRASAPNPFNPRGQRQ
jgi:hypothetical protein